MQKLITKFIISGIIGVALFVIMIIGGAFKDQAFWLPIVEFFVCMLYGTGWTFGWNYIKKLARKTKRTGVNVGVSSSMTGGWANGMAFGMIAMIFKFIFGLVIAVIVGNYLMVLDIFAAKRGVPLESDRRKFDGDKNDDIVGEHVGTVRATQSAIDAQNNASYETKQRHEEEINKYEENLRN